jgi:hypothetical protein
MVEKSLVEGLPFLECAQIDFCGAKDARGVIGKVERVQQPQLRSADKVGCMIMIIIIIMMGLVVL